MSVTVGVGSKTAPFREVKDKPEDEYGVQPTNPEVVFELIERWDRPN